MPDEAHLTAWPHLSEHVAGSEPAQAAGIWETRHDLKPWERHVGNLRAAISCAANMIPVITDMGRQRLSGQPYARLPARVIMILSVGL